MFRKNVLPPSLEQTSHSSTLKMEAAGSSPTLEPIYETIRCHIPADVNLHNHIRENTKSHRVLSFRVTQKAGNFLTN
jgi:hypothetical protein